jgi:hypothetical protein
VKIGQQVYLRFDPGQAGTVTAVDDGRFRVTWQDAERQSGQKRVRQWYDQAALVNIRRGEPKS